MLTQHTFIWAMMIMGPELLQTLLCSRLGLLYASTQQCNCTARADTTNSKPPIGYENTGQAKQTLNGFSIGQSNSFVLTPAQSVYGAYVGSLSPGNLVLLMPEQHSSVKVLMQTKLKYSSKGGSASKARRVKLPKQQLSVSGFMPGFSPEPTCFGDSCKLGGLQAMPPIPSPSVNSVYGPNSPLQKPRDGVK